MRRVSRIQTRDGVLHTTESDARAYCERKVGPLLTKHAHRLVHLDKYSQILSHLEEALPDFVLAARWRAEATEPLDTEDDDGD